MFRDLYRSRPHLGMIYVAMKCSPKLLWWKLPHDSADGCWASSIVELKSIARNR